MSFEHELLSEMDIENVGHDFLFLKPGCIKKMQKAKAALKKDTGTWLIYLYFVLV